ncbi:MAG: DNA mismatch repair endonuclease MutL [Erysipelotrichaceae bacterium]
MSKIKYLNEHLKNMIAAGEVVERPMGVVKELVENSIDANSHKIEIHLQNGGLDSIEVRDDGCGMDKKDATAAFGRHATSKIEYEQDLWNIHTMGFRGEALPSIASVSKLEMYTSDGTDQTKVVIEYGQIKEVKPAGCDLGTTIKVQSLFYKTPARLKHLKSANTELIAIIDLLSKFALAHPDIAFLLTDNDKVKLQTNGSNNLQETIMMIYGVETARKAIEVNFKDFDFEVEGCVISPVITRSSKQYINIFINNRVVKSFLLTNAVLDAYKQYIMDNRYPIVVLNIKADYQLVDVNVHPSKWEVRLSKERQLAALIKENVEKALAKTYYPSDMLLNSQKEKQEITAESLPKQKMIVQQTLLDRDDDLGNNLIERFSYLCQYHGKYIIASDEDNLYIIDQHAAQERCMYEEIQNQIASKEVKTQMLLVPLLIETNIATVNRIDELNEKLACVNIHFEQFSATTLMLREVPYFFENIDEIDFLNQLIADVINDKQMNVLEIRKEKIASLACHSSVRFNHYLSVEESKKLLARLSNCQQPFNCPHGRPTMITISDKQLFKEFKRG